jgi:hypothetical protein
MSVRRARGVAITNADDLAAPVYLRFQWSVLFHDLQCLLFARHLAFRNKRPIDIELCNAQSFQSRINQDLRHGPVRPHSTRSLIAP